MSRQVQDAYIVAAVRTPVGKAPRGMFRNTRPDDLLAHALKAAMVRCPGLDPALVDDVIVGCAMPEAEQGMNVARIGLLLAGFPLKEGYAARFPVFRSYAPNAEPAWVNFEVTGRETIPAGPGRTLDTWLVVAHSPDTDEVMRNRPTPLDEVKGGLAVLEQVVWEALPAWVRRVDDALRHHTGRGLPLEASPVRFGSWMGGDRDGNPNVLPETTLQASWLGRWMAADLFVKEIDALRGELSSRSCSSELRVLVGDTSEPYREAAVHGVFLRYPTARVSPVNRACRSDVDLSARLARKGGEGEWNRHRHWRS